MRILELQIKNFGKFSNKTIRFHDGINILYGKNEAGKSTIHSFIRAMLFGMEKARGRAAKYDEYSLREPWENPGYFAGVMRFESGGKIFRLERSFHKREKKASLICETDGEELSVENGDLDVLLEGLSETAFLNTFYIGQKGGAAGEALAGEIRNYISNTQSAGDAGIDVQRAIQVLETRRRRIEAAKKERLGASEDVERELQAKLAYVEQELRRLQTEEEACLDRINRLKKDLEQEKQKEDQEPEDRDEDTQRSGSGGTLLWAGMGITAFLISLLSSSFRMKLISAGLAVLAVILFFWCLQRKRAEQWEEEDPDEEYSEEDEEDPEEEDPEEDEEDPEKQYPEEDEEELEDPDEEYPEKEAGRERCLQLHGRLAKEKGHFEYVRNARKEKETIQENLRDSLSEISEKRELPDALDLEAEALKLAASTIRDVSKQVYQQYSGRLNRRVSSILSEITQGRYTSVFLDDQLNVRIHTPEKLLEIRQVSRGTMEQIYFALRMAAGELLSRDEPFPVILDEAFAMYDEERLEQTLCWLNDSGKQVLLFTCHRREGEILEKIREK